MTRVAAAFAVLMLVAQCGRAATCQDITLVLPHPLRTGERAFIEVQVGHIGPGQEIDVTTASGRPLGTISPFGIRHGHAAGTYTLPVPREAMANDRIRVRLAVTRAGTAPRAATPDEVLGVTLTVGDDRP